MTHAFWVLFKREMGAFLISPMAYVIFLVFAVVNGFAFQFCVEVMGQGVRNFTVMQIFFQIFYFWFCLLIMIPILTMRLFSEEYRQGTIELLMTAPVTDWDVVLAKFFGVFAFYVILWSPTVVYLFVFQIVSENVVPVPWGAVLLCYFLVLLIGLFYCAIGLFASALTKSQAVAAFASFSVIALLFFLGFLTFTTNNPDITDRINYISALHHMREFAAGTFDSRPVVWYLSGTILFLYLTQRVLAMKKLKT